jgi:YegS/Rv2252/BmrU family lipid kinase
VPGEVRRVFAIFNPASDGGRGAARIPRFLELLSRHLPGCDHAVTARSGEEGKLAEKALADGYDTIVAVGGDGTWSTVVDRILESDRPEVRLGVLPSGTGNDFGRNIGVRGDDLERAVQTLTGNHTITVDAGRVVGEIRHQERGETSREGRYFLNVVGFGFDIAVVEAAKKIRFLKGELLYKTTALSQLFRFPGFSLTLRDDEAYERSEKTLMLTLSNGPYFGGGFPIAPRASLRDGLLHSCLIKDANPFQRLLLFDRAGKGRHEGLDRVETHNAPAFRVSTPGPLRFEIDGDVYASSADEVRVEVRKGALQVLVPQDGSPG